jgi:ATP-binding cassette, subfamily C (CFTR/MRP), member 1
MPHSDPLNLHTDVELISALRRVGLNLEDENAPKEVQEGGGDGTSRFDLNSKVSEEGSNFSAGERQLLALCRALVKQSRVIVMDGERHL